MIPSRQKYVFTLLNRDERERFAIDQCFLLCLGDVQLRLKVQSVHHPLHRSTNREQYQAQERGETRMVNEDDGHLTEWKLTDEYASDHADITDVLCWLGLCLL